MPVQLFASAASWIDGEAVAQLERTALLPGMKLAVGLPDLHPGRGTPIGAAFFSEGILYPHLVGNDVGCGMALWQTSLARSAARLDRWARKLTGLEGPWTGAPGDLIDLPPAPGFEQDLGTIGGGNHFAELQQVSGVADPAVYSALGLVPERLMLLVHSGSRGVGQSVLHDHLERFGTAGLEAESAAGRAYLARHDLAVAWARVNRRVIASRFLACLGATATPILDVCHNSVQPHALAGRAGWLHRKGAAPGDRGPIVVAGSRGTLSYLVAPVGDQTANLATLAHGAGRKWGRAQARERLARRFSPDALRQTPLGGRVICEDRDLLYEEAPQAYKDIDAVVEDLVQAGLARVIATLSPLITYKTRRGRP